MADKVEVPYPGRCDTQMRCPLPMIMAKYNAALHRENEAKLITDYQGAANAKKEADIVDRDYVQPFMAANSGKVCPDCPLV